VLYPERPRATVQAGMAEVFGGWGWRARWLAAGTRSFNMGGFVGVGDESLS